MLCLADTSLCIYVFVSKGEKTTGRLAFALLTSHHLSYPSWYRVRLYCIPGADSYIVQLLLYIYGDTLFVSLYKLLSKEKKC